MEKQQLRCICCNSTVIPDGSDLIYWQQTLRKGFEYKTICSNCKFKQKLRALSIKK